MNMQKGVLDHVHLSTILVVEDHAAVRKAICLQLGEWPEFRVIGEASDGLEAVQLVSDLEPDLVLLDIGLPRLGGMEVARLIRSTVPSARVVFVSMESSPDIVRQAFGVGAMGYVNKLHLQNDLRPALQAAVSGRQFASSDAKMNPVSAPSQHDAQFYFDEPGLVQSVTRFVAAALNSGNPAVIIATESHREAIYQQLKTSSFDVHGAVQRGTVVSMDADNALSQVMVDGLPDRNRFLEGVTDLVNSVSGASRTPNPKVSIFGECAGMLWLRGNIEAALQLEQTGNELIKSHNVSILCSYPLGIFRRDEDRRAFSRVCGEHTGVHFR
jgi:DNA-binding NarL/FixJ family response regulator